MKSSIVIVGAGPYGLSIAAHLTQWGLPFRIFGKKLDTWQSHMPAGMLLKSDGFASSLFDAENKGSLGDYCDHNDIDYHDTDTPVGLDLFNKYAKEFQRKFVPQLEERTVDSLDYADGGFLLTLDNGEMLRASAVIMAVGITHFDAIPEVLRNLAPSLRSHSYAHHDLGGFAGRDVTVVGGGSSAVDLATLLSEAQARVRLIHRGNHLRFFSEPKRGPRSLWQRLRHPSSGLGPGLRSWLCETFPSLFRFLPGNARLAIAKRHLGPKTAWIMKTRFAAGVEALLSQRVEWAVETDGRVELGLRHADGTQSVARTDHVIAATGYAVDLGRLGFMAPGLRSAIRTHANMPVLTGKFETSVRGLYFVGPAAVDSFGPLMRFMVGAKYAAPVVAKHVAAGFARSEKFHEALQS
jgi:thioredoxin reductase